MQQPNKKKSSKKPWYKKPWGIALIILSAVTFTFPIVLFVLMWQSKKFPKWAKVAITVFVAIVAIGAAGSEESGNQTSQNDKTAQTSEQTAEDKAKQQAEDEAAAKEITKILIEGYVPRYCETHRQRDVPLPPADGGQYGRGKNNLTTDECRAIITYLVERVGTSAQILEGISNAHVAVGMNRHELLMSWGVPDDINSTHTAVGESAQWVYGNPIYGANYVYLDNDVVTAIQN